MAAGSIVIDLLMRTGAFETDTKRAEAALKRFQKTATDQLQAAAIAASVLGSAFLVMAKDSIDAMDQMNAAAQKTGIAVEAFSQLSYAAKMSGVETDSFTSAMVKFNKAIAEGATGSGGAADAFKAIGISAAELKASTPDEVLTKVAEKFAGFADGANKTALAIEIFGRAGADLIPLLNEGADGISKMRKEADDLGATISTSAAKSADQFNDNIDKMIIKMKSFVKGVASEVIPTMNILMETFLAGNSLMNTINAGMNLNLEGGLTGVGAQLARAELQLREADEKDKARLSAKVDAYRSAYNAMRVISGGAVTPTTALPQAPSLPSSVKTKTTGLSDADRLAKQELASADKFADALERQTKQLEFQQNLIGRNAQEVELLNAQYRVQAELEKTIQDMQRQGIEVSQASMDKMNEAAANAIAKQQEIINSNFARRQDPMVGISDAFRIYSDQANNVALGMQNAFTNAFKGMEDGIVKFAMTGKASFGDFANAVISDIMRIYIRMMITGLIGKAVGAFANPQSFAVQSGMNDIGTSDLGLGSGYSGGARSSGGWVPYAEGGYTGDGGKYEAKGVVHGGEFVFTKEATNRIGVGTLYRMMRGYADGGYVGSSAMPTGSGSGININIKNEAGGDGYTATATARKNETGFNIDVLVRKALTDDMRNNGPMSQTISATYGLRRSA